MNKTFTTLALMAITAAPALSYADCTRANLTGTWRIYTMFNSPGRCTLVMPSAGVTMSSSSYCYLTGQGSAVPLRGFIGINPDCHVYGSINAGGLARLVDGWISKGKDSISGITWSQSNGYVGHDFSGVKQ